MHRGTERDGAEARREQRKPHSFNYTGRGYANGSGVVRQMLVDASGKPVSDHGTDPTACHFFDSLISFWHPTWGY